MLLFVEELPSSSSPATTATLARLESKGQDGRSFSTADSASPRCGTSVQDLRRAARKVVTVSQQRRSFTGSDPSARLPPTRHSSLRLAPSHPPPRLQSDCWARGEPVESPGADFVVRASPTSATALLLSPQRLDE